MTHQRPSSSADGELADRVGFGVYGTITVLAAAGGLELEADTLHGLQAAAVLLVVSLAATMAHSLWRAIGARARRETVTMGSHELHELLRSWPILASGVPAAVLLAAAAAGAWSAAAALELTQAIGIAVLLVAGFITARLAGAVGWNQVTYVVSLPVTGLVIVALEVAAHHV